MYFKESVVSLLSLANVRGKKRKALLFPNFQNKSFRKFLHILKALESKNRGFLAIGLSLYVCVYVCFSVIHTTQKQIIGRRFGTTVMISIR